MKDRNFVRVARSMTACWLIIAMAGPFVQPLYGQSSKSIPLKDLDGHFPFAVPSTLEDWESRAEQLRMQLKLSLGLFPTPTLAPIQATIHSRRTMDGYTIDKVYFESLPGLYVTGNLYLPLVDRGPMPSVLCPDGHWDNGRFYWASDAEMKQLIASGAERFESSARNHLQARCVQLARMGCAAFHYDMLGYADSQQISIERAHRYGIGAPNPASPDGSWLLFSPTAEGHLQSVMGLQTINTLQALEFLRARTDIDPKRIAITGASGGGTQSFIAAAVDSRIAGSFPAVMVSTGMQGGCTCENASGLRVDTGNIEISALIAPRPLGMTAADDWTRTMERDGFPELKKLYGLYGAADRVSLFPSLHYPHNYNHVARVAMYGFMNKLFQLGLEEPILEKDFQALRNVDLTVWDKDHPAPPSGLTFERSLLATWAKQTQSQLNAHPNVRQEGWRALLQPAERLARSLVIVKESHTAGNASDKTSSIARIVNAVGGPVGGLKTSSSGGGNGGTRWPDKLELSLNSSESIDFDSLRLDTLVLSDPLGLDRGEEQSLVKNPRPAASYTYGYNAPLLLRRLSVLLKWLDDLQEQKGKPVHLSAKGPTLGFIAQAARFLRPEQVASVDVDGALPQFDNLESIRDPLFLPGALHFGELPRK